MRTQGGDEPFEQFVTDLKSLLNDCGYKQGMQNEMIRDHSVWS